jgi:hypothetical protein
MVAVSIVWRNPKHTQRSRCWTHVRSEEDKSLYLILESVIAKPGSWEGLPTLEIIHGRTAAGSQARMENQRLGSGL